MAMADTSPMLTGASKRTIRMMGSRRETSSASISAALMRNVR